MVDGEAGVGVVADEPEIGAGAFDYEMKEIGVPFLARMCVEFPAVTICPVWLANDMSKERYARACSCTRLLRVDGVKARTNNSICVMTTINFINLSILSVAR